MEAKTSEWRPGPTVCRCCLTEGCYKDISTEYFWMGKREVYSEMLSETFSVSISYSKSGGPNSQSRLICEQCISRLRDAADFKRQVVECEKMFMQHLDPGTSSVVEFSVPQVESSEKVKLERVKVEKVASDDDFDDGGFPEDDDDDDDLDDQPLMKLASKIPKKESLDLRDLLDNTKLVLKRKAPPTSKTKPVVPTKKLKSKKEVKPAPSKAKAVAKPAPKPVEKKKKEMGPGLTIARNAKIIVRYSTAYPFRLPDQAMHCVYCESSYTDPVKFREHVKKDHELFRVDEAFYHLGSNYYLKVDCTELSCRICSEAIKDLNDMAVHLKTHLQCQNLNLAYDIGLQPYILNNNSRLTCALCEVKVETIRALSRHMQTHYVRCTCPTCGKAYASTTSLHAHTITAHVGPQKYLCRKCKRYFSSLEAKRKHVENTPQCWPYLCVNCNIRFSTLTLRKCHFADVHGKTAVYECPECPESFKNAKGRRNHCVKIHKDKTVFCSHCDENFLDKASFDEHMADHMSNVFECTVCSKPFFSKKYLKQHMWMHSKNKKIECKLCCKQFIRMGYWKTHMQSHHPEVTCTDDFVKVRDEITLDDELQKDQ